jgi:hypothetical protein
MPVNAEGAQELRSRAIQFVRGDDGGVLVCALAWDLPHSFQTVLRWTDFAWPLVTCLCSW